MPNNRKENQSGKNEGQTEPEPGNLHQPLIGHVHEFRNGQDFEMYEEKFEQYCVINNITETRRVGLLISLICNETYKTLRGLCFPEKPSNKTYLELCQLLRDHHRPPKNIFRERINFYKAVQTEQESCSEWFVRLKRLAIDCAFTDITAVLKDKFVTGMFPGPVLDKIVEVKPSEELKKIFKIAVSKETALKTSSSQNNAVNAIKGKQLNVRENKNKFASEMLTDNTERMQKSRPRRKPKVENPNSTPCGKKHDGCNKCNLAGHLQYSCKVTKKTGTISLKEDIKLHETEHAWKRGRQIINSAIINEDKRTAELYRNVQSILNKLTLQKFDTLISQIKALPIDTLDRLQGLADLIFKNAVNSPNISGAYALISRELALMQFPINAKSEELVNFRKLLVTRCQMEFEKISNEENERIKKFKEIRECTDPEKKKDLTVVLEEDERRIRMKSLRNIRFMGELFKQQMLTANIMVRCLNNFIQNEDKLCLECLCKLLTTIGKELETIKVDLDPIFEIMKDIVDKKNMIVGSRVRFMLQDVIDLRADKWVPRRQEGS